MPLKSQNWPCQSYEAANYRLELREFAIGNVLRQHVGGLHHQKLPILDVLGPCCGEVQRQVAQCCTMLRKLWERVQKVV
ncbi:unnamed protein product [Cuscuta campestris]|uniref:Uncharacterized protein n=1 Tax=Cuscuta campestris TaxID=132261 RepID=A0A484M2G0_9ASTE|nr:unnamed protein product [Cuscuta campestris]